MDPRHNCFVDMYPRFGSEPVTAAPDDFVDRIGAELLVTLATAEAAAVLPWNTLTKAHLTEMRFHSIANWLPRDEASSLRQ